MTRLLPFALAVLLTGCESSDAIPEGASPLVEVEDATELVDHIVEEGNEVTVLNFWATWCGPCRIEFPDLKAFDEEMEGQGVEVRFVSVDDGEMMPQVREFLNEQGVTERSFVSPDNTMLAGQLHPMYGASLPVTFVVDAEGIVRGAHLGVITKDRLAEMVQGVRDGTLDITTQI